MHNACKFMHADLHSNTRHSAILRILRAAPVRKQDELVHRLREEGHESPNPRSAAICATLAC